MQMMLDLNPFISIIAISINGSKAPINRQQFSDFV